MSIPEHKRYFWCIIAILLGIASVIPMPANAQALEVKVQDQNGNPIPKAKVQIRSEERPQLTNESGVATFSDVSDTESLTISASRFLGEEIININERININAGQRKVLVELTSIQTVLSFQEVITSRYIAFQILVLLVVLAVLVINKGWSAHTNTAASILTIVGVLGTFIGIYIGLQNFNPNPNELQNSIEVLLNGLKIAFGTSIVGIASALLLKGLISPLFQKFGNGGDNNPRQETIDEFVGGLKKALESVKTSGELELASKLDDLTTSIKKDLTTAIEEGNEKTRNVFQGMMGTVDGNPVSLGNLHTLIAEGQGKTLTQLETLTQTVSDKHDLVITSQANEGSETRKTLTNMQSEVTGRQNKAFIQLRELTKTFSYEHSQLRKEFENFSQNVAESITELATKELIASLTNVIENFNSVISDQFGDNFKQLNEAVGKIMKWQKQYQQQMKELADEFRVAAESIEKSKEAVASIAESSTTISTRSESIVACTEKLDPILHTLNDQLDAFSELRQRALEAFPLIERRLNELTEDFSSAVQAAITASHESVETQRTALAEQTGHLQTTVENTTQDFNRLTTNFSGAIDTSMAQANDSMNQQREALTQRFSEFEGATGAVSQQLQETIDGIGSQLDDVFEESANHITQLTTGFAQNLTEQLEVPLNNFRDVVATAIADSQASMETQRTALNGHASTLQTTINDVSEQIDGIMQGVSNTVTGSQDSMDQQRQELLQLTQQLQSNCQVLEETLEAVLTESLQSLARTHGESLHNLGINLAAISDTFANDYTQVIEELQRLMNIISNNPNNREPDNPS